MPGEGGGRGGMLGECGQRLRIVDALAVGADDLEQQLPGDREHFGGASIGQAIVDVAGTALGHDEAVPAQHGQVLGEVRGLEPGFFSEARDADLIGIRKQLEDADAERMGQPFEEVRLHLVERTVCIT